MAAVIGELMNILIQIFGVCAWLRMPRKGQSYARGQVYHV